MTRNNKTPVLKHKLTTADKERLHILLRMRMIACGRREQVNRLVRSARKASQILSREQLKSKIGPQARAVVPVLIMAEIMQEMESCHGPKIIDTRPRSQRPYFPRNEQRGPEIEQNPPRIERNARPAIQIEQDVRQIRLNVPQIEGNALQMELNAPQIEINAPMEGNASHVERIAAQAEGNVPPMEENALQVDNNVPQSSALRNDPQIGQNGPQLAQVVQQKN